MRSGARTVAGTLRSAPAARRVLLAARRHRIDSGAPEAIESMHYGMPRNALDGPLFAFASPNHHVSP